MGIGVPDSWIPDPLVWEGVTTSIGNAAVKSTATVNGYKAIRICVVCNSLTIEAAYATKLMVTAPFLYW